MATAQWRVQHPGVGPATLRARTHGHGGARPPSTNGAQCKTRSLHPRQDIFINYLCIHISHMINPVISLPPFFFISPHSVFVSPFFLLHQRLCYLYSVFLLLPLLLLISITIISLIFSLSQFLLC